jgi:rRNA pseudouridine-1189 N-methylase Emg1 (Nep1/Mra1 family)
MYVPLFLAGRKETCSPADQDDPSRQHLSLVAELKKMINKQPVEKVYVQVHHHSLVSLNNTN